MKNTNNRPVIILSALLMALVILSSSVGLDDAEAKKKKKKKRTPPAPALVVVQCAQQGVDCTGALGNDLLVCTGEFERINGSEGNDVYDGKTAAPPCMTPAPRAATTTWSPTKTSVTSG